jgi:FlaA1/EpsC-like NDP-sugar epimerase
MLRKTLPLADVKLGRRVVIYGAGDGGELLFRALLLNNTLQRIPVAFLDDDPRKGGRMLHGLPIGSPNGAGSIAALCRGYNADELLVSTTKLPPTRLRQLIEECENAGVSVGRMNIAISPLE